MPKGTSPEKLWQELEAILKQNPERYDVEAIRRAFIAAKKCHEGQKRKAGEPYICHPLRAAIDVAKFQIDTPTVQAALLHDVVEDTPCTIEKIKAEFGDTVGFLVDGVTKLGHVKYRGVEETVENLRKMMLAVAKDIRVILIKLADRFDNMQDLNVLAEEKQKRFALETLDIYAPIAHRLGIGELAGDLEDLAFPYVYPKEYKWLLNNVGERYESRKRYVTKLIPVLENELKANGITPITCHARAKHYYSLYRKLLRKGMSIDTIYDLVALRAVVHTIEECYAALGVVHSLWKPVPGRIKDYIALPKPNGYRSLHTTVFGPEGVILEIQIRTQEMHEEAERGIAAHWKYSESDKRPVGIQSVPKELAWINQLQNWQKEYKRADEFIESLKIDFFQHRIFAITPKGSVMDLPEGATPVDFAYHIHTDIGNQCAGAKVNGKIVPLDYRLQSGDVVEILTQKNKLPSEQWLEFVKTSFARNKILETLRKKRNLSPNIKKSAPQKTEFRISVKDRVGLIKDISRVFASLGINIQDFTTGAREPYDIITVTCQIPKRNKAEELSVKLKKIPNVESVSFKIK